jgi:hypothetical protein
MRNVDHRIDLMLAKIPRQPFDAAEAADPRRQGLRARRRRAAGERQRRFEARIARESLRQRRGFGRAAEDEDAHG